MEAMPRWHVLSVAALAAFGAILLAPSPGPRFASTYDAREYPESALRSIAASGGMDRIFSTDVWGGYMIYRMYPKVKVFVDGRSDFYGPAFDGAYTDVMNVKPGWENRLRQHGIQTVLVPPDSYLSGALKESKNWRCIFDDGIAIAFRPVGFAPANATQVSPALTGGGRDRTAAATGTLANPGNRLLSDSHS